MSELKPCPFCGEKDSIVRMYAAGNQKHFVRCMMCRTDTAEFLTEYAAISAWNRRAASPAVRELVEAAKILLKAHPHYHRECIDALENAIAAVKREGAT